MTAQRASCGRSGNTRGLYDLAEPDCDGGTRVHRWQFNGLLRNSTSGGPRSSRPDSFNDAVRPQSFHTEENEIALSIRNLFIEAAAAAVLAASSIGPALAQTVDHSHDAAAPHKLALNQGKKWSTDEPLRAGMGRIRGLVEPQLGAAHAGKLTPAQYNELAARIETEVGGIVANCKLEPKADAMLHLLIADLGDGTSTMTGKNPKQRPALGLVKVAQTVDQYGSHFEHPGFKPIGIVH